MAPLAVVGAVRWAACHPGKASKLPLAIDDFDSAALCLPHIYDKFGVTVAELEQYGRDVKARGYLRQRNEKTYEYAPGRTETILRSIKRKWQQIDGIINKDATDMEKRYSIGTQWLKNSCAVDCTLYLGIIFDLGRLQIDQVTGANLAILPEPAKALRKIMRRKWSSLDHTQRTEMRDILRDSLTGFNASIFPPSGAQLPLSEVVDVCFKGIPQLSFTRLDTLACCDGNTYVSDKVTPSRNNAIYIFGLPVQSALQSIFDPSPVKTSAISCTAGSRCTGAATRRPVVLDRMPPTLIVHMSPVTRAEGRKEGIFDDITLKYWQPHGLVTIQYHPVACVMVTGTESTAHFFVVWHHDDKFMLYDGLKDHGEVSLVQSFFQRNARTVLIVFRIEESVTTTSS